MCFLVSHRCRVVFSLAACVACTGLVRADGLANDRPKKVLLIGESLEHQEGQSDDSSDFMQGLRILEACLTDIPDLVVEVIEVGEEWPDGAEKIREADGILLYLSEGAKWVHADVDRLEAMAQLASRGGGIAALHGGMETQQERYIEGFLKLLGGCHGGPDRHFAEIEVELLPATPEHAILRGVEPLTINDEFYFDLKFIDPRDSIVPILQATIEDEPKTIAWAWERSDGGRSFGFSGLHFHANWSELAYRRTCAQGVLWMLDIPIPEEGLPCEISDDLLPIPSEAIPVETP